MTTLDTNQYWRAGACLKDGSAVQISGYWTRVDELDYCQVSTVQVISGVAIVLGSCVYRFQPGSVAGEAVIGSIARFSVARPGMGVGRAMFEEVERQLICEGILLAGLNASGSAREFWSVLGFVADIDKAMVKQLDPWRMREREMFSRDTGEPVCSVPEWECVRCGASTRFEPEEICECLN